MNKKDKLQLQQLGIIGFIFAFAAICLGFTKKIPWGYIAIAVLAIQYVFVAPKLCSKYYKLHEQNIGFQRFIPVWNELQMFSGWVFYASLVATIIAAVSVLATQIPNDVIGGIFGLKAGMFWGYNSSAVAIIIVFIASCFYGIGFCQVLFNINMFILELYDTEAGKLETVAYSLVLFVPFLRIGPMLGMWSKVVALARLDKKEDTSVFIEQ